MLADTVATHVSLDSGGMHVLVGFDKIDDIVFVSTASPGVLDALGCSIALAD